MVLTATWGLRDSAATWRYQHVGRSASRDHARHAAPEQLGDAWPAVHFHHHDLWRCSKQCFGRFSNGRPPDAGSRVRWINRLDWCAAPQDLQSVKVILESECSTARFGDDTGARIRAWLTSINDESRTTSLAREPFGSRTTDAIENTCAGFSQHHHVRPPVTRDFDDGLLGGCRPEQILPAAARRLQCPASATLRRCVQNPLCGRQCATAIRRQLRAVATAEHPLLQRAKVPFATLDRTGPKDQSRTAA